MPKTKTVGKKREIEQVIDLEDEESEEEDPDAEFEVEAILSRSHNHYLVKWKNYSIMKSTWEPKTGLSQAKDVVKHFTNHIEPKLSKVVLEQKHVQPAVKKIINERTNEKVWTDKT